MDCGVSLRKQSPRGPHSYPPWTGLWTLGETTTETGVGTGSALPRIKAPSCRWSSPRPRDIRSFDAISPDGTNIGYFGRKQIDSSRQVASFSHKAKERIVRAVRAALISCSSQPCGRSQFNRRIRVDCVLEPARGQTTSGTSGNPWTLQVRQPPNACSNRGVAANLAGNACPGPCRDAAQCNVRSNADAATETLRKTDYSTSSGGRHRYVGWRCEPCGLIGRRRGPHNRRTRGKGDRGGGSPSGRRSRKGTDPVITGETYARFT